MGDSLFDQLRARGEAFFTELSNNLMANPTFIEMLKRGVAVKEAVDKQVAEALRNMNVATRRDIASLDARIAELESELETIRGTRAPARRPAAARSRTRAASPSRKKAARA